MLRPAVLLPFVAGFVIFCACSKMNPDNTLTLGQLGVHVWVWVWVCACVRA